MRKVFYPYKRKFTQGFTLIEILVVISIIAVLMAFIFPSVMKAKEAAAATADLSQLSQINKAFLMYTSDHDGRYPSIKESSDEGEVRIPGIPGRSAVYTWVHRIFPYVKSLETFWSPATKNCKVPGREFNFRDKNEEFAYYFGYYPSWGYNSQYFSPKEIPIYESKIQDPTQTILLSTSTCAALGHTKEVKKVGYYEIFPPSKQLDWNPKLQTSKEHAKAYGCIWPRFRSGTAANTAFADGHVKTLKIEDLKQEELWQVQKGVSWKD